MSLAAFTTSFSEEYHFVRRGSPVSSSGTFPTAPNALPEVDEPVGGLAVAGVENRPGGVFDHVPDWVCRVGVVGLDDVDRELPDLEAVALRDLLELVLRDVPPVGPRLLLAGHGEAVVGRVERSAGVREDRCLARPVDVVRVLVCREDCVRGLHVHRIERHRDHPDGSRGVARPDVRIDEEDGSLGALEHEPVAAEIPDGDGLRIGRFDGAREPVAPVARRHTSP
jgi:hypothetical protein